MSLRWRHNRSDGVSNYQPHHCLFYRLFRRRSNKTSKLRVTGLCAGNSPGPVNSSHKWSVTRKMSPFDDVIMWDPVVTFQGICSLSGRAFYRKISERRNAGLNFSNRSEIWQVLQQHCCRDTCQTSERHDYNNTQYRGFETWRQNVLLLSE